MNVHGNFSRQQFIGGLAAAFGGLILPADAFGVGTPILKFGLVSDVHLGGEGKDADLENVLRYFDAQGVDAVMIPGDIAHTGLIKEFERFAAIWYRVFPNDRGSDGRRIEKLIVTGNHCIDGWAGRWKGWSEERLRAERFNYADNPQKTWQRLFHEDWHDIFVKTVKGIPFIGAQWKSEQAPFVKPPIAETVVRLAPTFDPKRPFFFFQHDPPDGTCHARRGDKVLREALSPYSNAVAITGHTHDSISDDRSVWQGSFTSIGAGCMHEAGAGVDFRNVNYFWHKPSRTKPMRTTEWIARGGCCSVVEVFADHLVMHRRSVQRTEAIGEDWAVPLPAAFGKGFDFKVRESRTVAPQFDPGAKVKVAFCPTGHPEQAKRYAGQPCVAIDFPAAQTPRGVVSEYEVAARLQDGPEIVRTRVIPNGFGLDKARMTIPGTCLFKTRELAGTRPVVFSVTAGECFGKRGRPIESVPFSFDETAALKLSRKMVWCDEFDGTDLDKEKWGFRATMNSDDCLYANDARTYEVKDSKLCLHVRPSPDPVKRCLLPRGVSTHETMAFKYGYMEMRAKVPFRHGAWPSWWMTVSKARQKCAWMSEVDIFEVFSSKNEVVANLHKWGWNNQTKKMDHVMLPGGEGVTQESRGYRFPDFARLNDEFHVYGFEWTPRTMSFFVDGMRYCTIPIDGKHDYSPKPLKGMAGHHDFHSVIFNNEVFTPGHGWMPKGSELKPEDLPIDYEIDWIRLYQRDGEEIRLGNDITTDVQSRIDAAFKAGGGTVSIGKGEWTIRGIRLRSNVTLHLAAGAVVRASRNMDDFDVLSKDAVEPLSEVEKNPGPAWLPPGKRPDGWKGPLLYPCSRWNRAIISVYKARNVRIVGDRGAVIDGMNAYDPQGEEGFRGAHGIMAFDSENIEVRGVEIRRTGNWATRFFRCHDVAFRDLKVRGGHDGVHVRLCDRVTVKGCDFRCGDDCVAGFDNEDVTVEDCRMNTACSAFRFGGRHVRIRRCTASGPGEWPIRNSLPLEDRIAGRDCLGQGRRNMLSFFTYFADLSHGGVKTDQGDVLIEDCTVKDVDRFLHYNFSGNEVWQCGRPLRDVTFRRCTATGLGMSLCAYGAEKLPLALKIEECSFSFARPIPEFIRAAHLDSLKADHVKINGVTGPFVRYWGERAPSVTASAVEGMGTEVRPATEEFRTKAI